MTHGAALVVGSGSIGTRHRRVLEGLGLSVATLSRRGNAEYDDLGTALGAFKPGYVVIATETSAHLPAIEALAEAGFDGTLLVEKPLLMAPAALPTGRFARACVGYNLRYHPTLAALRERLAGETIVAAAASVGQHLADWRPGRAYQDTYSAQRAQGGGVLRDLSHEIDYMLWLFGAWQSVAAQVVSSGTLGIDADDVANLLIHTADCPAMTIALDYHRRPATRTVSVITARHTLNADLMAGTLAVDGALVVNAGAPERDASFVAMHQAALGDGAGLCDFAQGLAVVELIAAAEKASASGARVAR